MAKRMMAFCVLIALASASCGFLTPPAIPTPAATYPPLPPDAKVLNLDIVNMRPREQETAEIVVGTTVIWLHDTSQLHNVRHTPHITGSSQVFKSGNFDRGEEFRYTFDEVGEFKYFCEVHSGHSFATIFVVEEGKLGTSGLNEKCTGTIEDRDDGRVCKWQVSG